MISGKIRKKILKNYYTLKYPGSFQGVSAFRRSLKENSDIDITHSALRRILKSSLPYQVNVIKPKKFKTRALYSRGVHIEAYFNPIFVPYQTADGEKRTLKHWLSVMFTPDFSGLVLF